MTKLSIGVSFARQTVTTDGLRTLNVPVRVQIRVCTYKTVHTIRNSSVLYCTDGTSRSLVKDRSSCHHLDYSGIRSISAGAGAGSNHGPCVEMEQSNRSRLPKRMPVLLVFLSRQPLYLYTMSTAPGPLAMGLCVTKSQHHRLDVGEPLPTGDPGEARCSKRSKRKPTASLDVEGSMPDGGSMAGL